jgi:hypothetical protein
MTPKKREVTWEEWQRESQKLSPPGSYLSEGPFAQLAVTRTYII